jgi:hypothetical protein
VPYSVSKPYRICPVCGGSLQDSTDDPGWVKCFACSRSFDAKTINGDSTVPEQAPAPLDRLSITLAEAKRSTDAAPGAKAPVIPTPYVRRVLH